MIGCGINWESSEYYFTRNGSVVCKPRTPTPLNKALLTLIQIYTVEGSYDLIYRKQYLVITISNEPYTIRVNFSGLEEFLYKDGYLIHIRRNFIILRLFNRQGSVYN